MVLQLSQDKHLCQCLCLCLSPDIDREYLYYLYNTQMFVVLLCLQLDENDTVLRNNTYLTEFQPLSSETIPGKSQP